MFSSFRLSTWNYVFITLIVVIVCSFIQYFKVINTSTIQIPKEHDYSSIIPQSTIEQTQEPKCPHRIVYGFLLHDHPQTPVVRRTLKLLYDECDYYILHVDASVPTTR